MKNELVKISEILEELKQQEIIANYCLIGGIALNVHGVNRATSDIDMLVMVNTEQRQKLINKLEEYELKPVLKLGDKYTDPIPCMICAEYNEIDIDIICVSMKWELESLNHVLNVKIDNTQIPVVDPYYFTILKLKAGGPQDLLDVEKMLSIDKTINKTILFELAERFRVSNQLDAIYKKVDPDKHLVKSTPQVAKGRKR